MEHLQLQMNPRLSLVFLPVHLTQTLRPPGLIWPKLVRRSRGIRIASSGNTVLISFCPLLCKHSSCLCCSSIFLCHNVLQKRCQENTQEKEWGVWISRNLTESWASHGRWGHMPRVCHVLEWRGSGRSGPRLLCGGSDAPGPLCGSEWGN